MKAQQTIDLKLSDTEVEGMIRCDWNAGTRIEAGESLHLICLDGKVWKLIDREAELLGFLRPENCRSCADIRSEIQKIISHSD